MYTPVPRSHIHHHCLSQALIPSFISPQRWWGSMLQRHGYRDHQQWGGAGVSSGKFVWSSGHVRGWWRRSCPHREPHGRSRHAPVLPGLVHQGEPGGPTQHRPRGLPELRVARHRGWMVCGFEIKPKQSQSQYPCLLVHRFHHLIVCNASVSVSIHVYQSSDNIRNRKNSMKMQHSASILCILWVCLVRHYFVFNSKITTGMYPALYCLHYTAVGSGDGNAFDATSFKYVLLGVSSVDFCLYFLSLLSVYFLVKHTWGFC